MRTSALKRFVLAYLLALPPAALAITPVDGGSVGGTTTVVNNGAGDQTDPHVSGDLAAYTDQSAASSIRYFTFPSGPDLAIPGGTGTDFLSDVSNGRITFTRILDDPGRGRIMVFTPANSSLAEVAPSGTAHRVGAAIGNNTVAFIEVSAAITMFVADLGSGSLTEFSGPAQGPAVSPNGNVVVWEQCRSILDCDVMRSTRSGTWSAAAFVAVGANNPDTDGTFVTYDDISVAGNSSNIYYQSVSGGASTQLELAGVQSNPAISAGVIAFESRTVLGAPGDIYIYVIGTNTLFRVTDTVEDDTLSDVTVLPTGEVRVVWATNDGLTGDYNIYARTFTVPLGSVVDTIPELIALVESLNLQRGISNSLDAKLENAQKALERARAGDTGSACHLMDAFINEVNAQEGHELTVAQADRLRGAAGAIKTALGCA